MTLEEIKEVLVQSAQVAQKKGAFSLDNAVVVKQAIDLVQKENATQEELSAGLKALTQAAELGQARGAYTLRDAYFIYGATISIDEALGQTGATDTVVEDVDTRQEVDATIE